MTITNITKPKGANGTSGMSPTNGTDGTDAIFTQNGKIGADELTVNATGGEGGDGGNGTGGAAGANGGKGGNAAITLNGNIFNAPATTSLVVSLNAIGGNTGLAGTGTPPGSQSKGGNATVTVNGNIIQPNKAMTNIELDAIAQGGNGSSKGNASATLNGNIVQPSKGATTVTLKAQASNLSDNVSHNGDLAYGTKTATLNGNIVQGNIANVFLTADAFPSNGTANVNGNIVQVSANTALGTAVTLEATGNHIAITNNKITLGKHTFNLTINGYSAYDNTIKDNEFKGSGTNVFNFTDNALPGPHHDTVTVDLGAGTFVFNGNSNLLTGFNAVSVAGSGVNATLIGGPGDDILIGGDGDDVLIGGGGNDILRGKGGNDILDGGDGDDFLYGGDGDDILLVSTGTDVLDGVTDPLGDTASFANATGPTGVTVDLNSAGPHDYSTAFNNVPTITTLLNIQNVTGTNFADTLVGDGQNNTLTGGTGNDILRGNGGNDTLNGGADSDTALYTGNYLTDYTVNVDASGNGTVSDTRMGAPDGSDMLTSIEFIQFNDGTYNTATQTFVPNGPPDIAPVLTTSGGTTPANEQVAIAIDGGLTVTDIDSPNLTSATVSITGGFQSGEDLLSFSNQNGITGSYNTGTGVLTLTGSATQANYQAALRSVTYTDTSDTPNGGNRTISFTANDGILNSNIGTKTVSVTAVNDAPVATITPPTYSATEQTVLDLKNNGLAISDVDAGAGSVTATLSVTEGVLNVAAGTSGANVSGSGTGTVTLTGTLAQINALLNTDGTSTVGYFDGSDAPSPSATLSLSVNDNGNTGTGGPLMGNDTATINITAVNDAPVLDPSKSPALMGEPINAGVPVGAVGTLVSSLVDFAMPSGQVDNVTDPDAGAQLGIAVTAQDSINGTWYFSTDNGANWNPLGAVSNTTAQLLAADAGTRLYFKPNTNFAGTVTSGLTFRAWDRTSGTNGGTGNTTSNGGSTPYSTLTDTVSVTISGGEEYFGTPGNDTHTGTAGDDIMHVSAGTDVLDGGPHINGDTLVFDTVTVTGVTYAINSLSPVSYTTIDGPGQTTASNFENLTGSDYSDILVGDNNRNTLSGGAGDDLLVVTAGGDTLIGGSDNGGGDTADFSDGTMAVTVNLQTVGSQLVSAEFGNVTLNTIENLTGTDYNDTLIGDGGKNTLTGGNGDDLLVATAGGDTLDGGANGLGGDTADFSDALSGVTVTLGAPNPQNVGGGIGNITLTGIENVIGTDYNDTLTGDVNKNTLTGGAGDDILFASAGGDTLDGGANGAGGDTANFDLAVSAVTVSLGAPNPQNVGGGIGSITLTGIENLTGSDYDDLLVGDTNANILNGGAGDDLLVVTAGGDTLIGGSDNGGGDTADFSDGTMAVTVTLQAVGAQLVSAEFGNVTLNTIENLTGTDYDDTLVGDNGMNVLMGGAGNDLLVATAGGDTLDGGANGAGGDTADFSDAVSGVTVTLGAPNPQNVGGGIGNITLTGIENVIGTDYNDSLAGDGGKNILTGGAGDDVLYATGGGDTLDGGSNTLVGDTANFTAALTSGVTANLGSGTATGVDFGTVTLSGIENLTGTGYADNLTGDGGDNILDGFGGDDVLNGGAGNDALIGGAGIDTAVFSTQPGVADVTYNGNFIVNGPDGTDTLVGIEKIDDVGGGSKILLVGAGGYATINAAIAAANAGDTILIAPGTYNENVLVDKSLTIQGVGVPGGVIIEGTFTEDNGNFGGQLSTWMQTAPGYNGASGTGITVAADNVTLNNITVDDFLTAVSVSGASVTGLTLDGVATQHSMDGFTKPDATALNGLNITNSTFQDEYRGASFFNDTTNGSALDATDTSITNSTFTDIDQKGIYMETAQGNTTLDGLTMNNVGQYGGVPSWGADGLHGNGIDLNLKYHTYTGDVTISNFDLTNTGGSAGQNGAIVVEGRDDPTGYSTIPADVSGLNVTISNGIINGTSTGIRTGENKADPAQNDTGPAVLIDGVTILNAIDSEIDNHTKSLMTVIGTNGDDTYLSRQTVGSTGPISFQGLGGNDYLAGGLGNDTLQGGAGDDVLDGGTGGVDTADYSDATSDGLVVDLAAGTSTGGYGMLSNEDTLFNIENLTGSSHNDTLIGDSNDNVLRGGAGDDALDGNGGTDTADYSDATMDGLVVDLSAGTSSGGGLGNDTLVNIANLKGSAFSDTLIGDAGNNVLTGGAGDDYLDGGPGGSDTADYSDATMDGLVVDLSASTSSGGGLGNDTLSNIQNVSGSAFNDVLIGDDGDNTLIGGAGNDIFFGHGGSNSLIGGDGTDVAYYSGLENDLNDPYSVLGAPPAMAVFGGPEGISDGLSEVERVKFLSPSHVSDANNDGYGDLVFQDTTTGDLTLVEGPNPGSVSPVAAVIGGTNWTVVGTGQFSPDDPTSPRNAGVLLQDSGTGDLKVVTDLTGAPVQTLLSTQPGSTDWKAISSGDFNGDAASDILLQNQVTGATEIMFLNTSSTDAIGTVDSTAAVAAPGANWKAIAVGDFNGDGKSDIVWQDSSTKKVEVYLMDGATVASHSAALATSNLTAVGTGDFNGDGRSDILFKNASGQAVLWFMNGTAHSGTKTVTHAMTPGVTWSASGAADVDGNGYSDIIWTDTGVNLTGATDASLMSGSSVNPSVTNANLTSPGAGSAFKLFASTGGG